MIDNILCATDGSKVSEKATVFALNLARSLGKPVTFLSVETVSPKSASSSPFWDSNILDAGDAITRAAFAHIGDQARSLGVAGVSYVTVEGRNIAEAITGFAKSHGHDHIVMGSHGDTGVKAMVLGSVAQHVVAKAHVPVTIVR